jgi:hypothetical protein
MSLARNVTEVYPESMYDVSREAQTRFGTPLARWYIQSCTLLDSSAYEAQVEYEEAEDQRRLARLMLAQKIARHIQSLDGRIPYPSPVIRNVPGLAYGIS